MEDYFRAIIQQKIVDSQAARLPLLTRRDAWLPVMPGKALAVIGMRRAGKTSLLYQIMTGKLAAASAAGQLLPDPRAGLLYFSFEDERLAGMEARHLDLLVEAFYQLQPDWRDQRRATWLLDEIQLVPGWEVFIRRLLDSENIELYLSGSSARLLSREVATSMRGRAMETVVYPFSFRECLRHRGEEPGNVQALTKSDRSRLRQRLDQYLVEGGFPEAQGLDVRTRHALLSGYVDIVLLRDVIERHAVSQPLALRWLVRQLLANAACCFSINKFHADLKSQGVAIGKDSLHQYLGYLEDTFLLRSVPIATTSEARRRVNPRKIYPIDQSLIPLFDRSGKANTGHALETAVLLELERRGAQVSYVRTPAGYEVDFLAVLPDGSQQLVQVCASVEDAGTRERETRALHDAATEWPQASLHLIALDMQPGTTLENIHCSSALDWFLQPV